MQTIPQQFFETAQRFPSRIALRYKQGDAYVGIRFDELSRRVLAFAAGLRAIGVEAGQRVAILSENRPEWVIADLATLRLGAVSVPVHPTLSASLIVHILKDSGSNVLIVSQQELWEKLLSLSDQLPQLETLIPIHVTQADGLRVAKSVVTFSELLKRGGKQPQPVPDSSQLDSLASIVYTSGTTGLPKGVMLTHRNFMFDADGSLRAVPVDEHDVLLSFLPLSHVLERTAGYYAPLVCRGACIAYAESPKTLTANLQEVRPTILVAVPRIFEKIYDGLWAKINAGSPLRRRLFVATLRAKRGSLSHRLLGLLVIKKIHRKFGGRLRITISGGASLHAKLGKFFEKLDFTIIEGYGLTETSPVITVNRPSEYKFGTVGYKLSGVELKLGADKEILTRGPHVMVGYHQNPTATAEMIDTEGWLHTGDLGFLDADGFLTIIGRKKEMLVTAGGKNVWPEAVELALNNDRLVAQSMVVGHGRAFVTALIVPYWPGVLEIAKTHGLSQDPHLLAQDPIIVEEFSQRVARACAELAEWECVKKFRLLVDEFSQERDELTPTLKLRRATIAAHYKNEIEKLYSSGG